MEVDDVDDDESGNVYDDDEGDYIYDDDVRDYVIDDDDVSLVLVLLLVVISDNKRKAVQFRLRPVFVCKEKRKQISHLAGISIKI